MQTPIFGALALVRIVLGNTGDIRVLSVNRRNRPLDFALPCGKVDPGEEPIVTMARELFEETGVKADEALPLYVEEVVPGEPIQVFLVTKFHGQPHRREEGITPLWLPFSYLEGEQCTYKVFSRRLREYLASQGMTV